MMIVLDCPGCGKRYEVDGSLAGKKSRCKDCGNIFRLRRAVSAVRSLMSARGDYLEFADTYTYSGTY